MFANLKLRQQARIDYQQARGTAHKALLQSARKNLLGQQTEHQSVIQSGQTKISHLQKERGQKQKEALTRHLVHDRLTEVPGIGKNRKNEIVQHVFRGELTDLYKSHQLPGIGERTQAAINQWVHQCRHNFSQLLAADFPGKHQINVSYRQKVQFEQEKIAAAEEGLKKTQEALHRIAAELDWLEKISIGEFYRTLKSPGTETTGIDHYVQGVFAEWEPMPAWFREVLMIANTEAPAIRNVAEHIADRGETTNARSGSSSFVSGLKDKRTPAILISIGAIILCWICFPFSLFSNPEAAIVPTVMPTAARIMTKSVEPTITYTPQPSMTPTVTATATARPSRTATATATIVPRLFARVNSSAANVRAGPGVETAVITVVRIGDTLPVLESNEAQTWFLVELSDGSEGWIGSSVVTLLTNGEDSP